MHRNFFHWHSAVDLTPTLETLKLRWNAASDFALNLERDKICELLCLSLFGEASEAFNREFSEALVTEDVTFPPDLNSQLLQVMATAANVSLLNLDSGKGDAVALAAIAATSPAERVTTYCAPLREESHTYLRKKCEVVRSQPEASSQLRKLRSLNDSDEPAPDAGQLRALASSVMELSKRIGCIAEESQFMWWLLGKRSTFLRCQRSSLDATAYAIVAAEEAAMRVVSLPPPEAVESIIEVTIEQCKRPGAAKLLAELLNIATLGSRTDVPLTAQLKQLCPLSSLIQLRASGQQIDEQLVRLHRLPTSEKIRPSEIACRYFREIMFLQALEEL